MGGVKMTKEELNRLKSLHYSFSVNRDTSNGQRQDSITILSLIEIVLTYQDGVKPELYWDASNSSMSPKPQPAGVKFVDDPKLKEKAVAVVCRFTGNLYLKKWKNGMEEGYYRAPHLDFPEPKPTVTSTNSMKLTCPKCGIICADWYACDSKGSRGKVMNCDNCNGTFFYTNGTVGL